MNTKQDETQGVGTIRKLVSLVDRGKFDEVVYPQSETSTVFQPTFKPYHNFTTDVVSWPFAGTAEWGKRLTFTVPYPWETDMISWVALRLKPAHWLPRDAYNHLYLKKDWTYQSPGSEWIWAKSLGSIAIAKAELEIDGVTVEQWSGDWIDVWSRTSLDTNKGAGWDDAVTGPLGGTEDGSIYCYLPFWFARWINVSYPLISSAKPFRIHITLRPFHEVVRMRSLDKTTCDQTPLGSTFKVQDLSLPFRYLRDVSVGLGIPTMDEAELVCGTAQIDGELRTAYRDYAHELLMVTTTEMRFGEPLKYRVGVPKDDCIRIGLPLTAANGPIRQLMWIVRRKDTALRSEWTNYSATLEGEGNATYNPPKPLMRSAQLMVGTAVWADQKESWWRQTGALPLEGGIRAFGNYVYVYNFTETPDGFDPNGTINASRVDVRLNLEIEQPPAPNNEWEVVVFLVGTNWMRFQNGLPNRVFMD
jgi:hypothetical protein